MVEINFKPKHASVPWALPTPLAVARFQVTNTEALTKLKPTAVGIPRLIYRNDKYGMEYLEL